MRRNGANGWQVGMDCLWDGHLWLDWWAKGVFLIRQTGDPQPPPVEASWCLWCGTGVHSGDIDTYTKDTPT